LPKTQIIASNTLVLEEVVITGVGIVSPIGIGRDAFWQSLCQGRSGVGLIQSFDASGLPNRMAAEVRDFEPKQHVPNRKQLKVMCRDAQLGVAAAQLACREAGITADQIDRERFGVVLGADRICSALDDSQFTYRACLAEGKFDFRRWGIEGMGASFPLSFLKVLPNMIASHVSIVHDARGPNNTIHQADASSLLAVAEALSVIRRGAADVMLTGGASSLLNPFDCVRHCVMGILSPRQENPAAAVRPFDADRDGQVFGEGAAVFVLERHSHAKARGARILARVIGAASACEASLAGRPARGDGLRRAMLASLAQAGIHNGQLGHINAHGLSMRDADRVEAEVIHSLTPETPVTASKSYFGNLGAAAGAMEMAVSLLALGAGCVPMTLNYERRDPACPVRVIHGEPLISSTPSALVVNQTSCGQAAAVVLAGPD
jgi:3-oxoacyl-[acyl-carrier-protein] synthase II